MKIFWSWQSDTPGKTGRHFIRQALDEAIAALKEPEEVEEPVDREIRDALHLDQDRAGVTGSPDLAPVILEKIDASLVFVADITPVSAIPGRLEGGREIPEKRNMNPNVAIELGYALKSLSDRNVLMVLNQYYGDRRYLPFDLAHKAGPIIFDLPHDADRATRERVAAALKGNFVTALRPFLQGQAAAAAPNFEPMPFTTTPAIYFTPGEALAEFGEPYDRIRYTRHDGRGFYLRVMPWTPLQKPLVADRLRITITRAGLRTIGPDHSNLLYAVNKYGAIVVDPENPARPNLNACTQVFENGEIWGIAPCLLREIPSHGKLVHAGLFEKSFRARLSDYVTLLQEGFGIAPPYSIQAGAVGLEEFRIVTGADPEDRYGPFRNDMFKIEKVLNSASQQALDKIVIDISEELFRVSGFDRPDRPLGFP